MHLPVHQASSNQTTTKNYQQPAPRTSNYLTSILSIIQQQNPLSIKISTAASTNQPTTQPCAAAEASTENLQNTEGTTN